MNRGNRRALIFEDDRDRRRFVRILIETVREYHVKLLGGTQMGNHFHLVVLTPHANLSQFMQQLEGRFAEYSNWRHARDGHLFQGRFKGVIVENDIHLFTAMWYVFTNPVAACLVGRPEDWKWSTYGATAGLASVPDYLSIEWVETLFPASSLEQSQCLLRQCMNDPRPVQAYLQAAEPTMSEGLRSYVSERSRDVAQPCTYQSLMRPPIEDLFPTTLEGAELIRAIVVAHEMHGFKMAEIAHCVGRHPTTVSRIYGQARVSSQLLNSGSDPDFNGRGRALELHPRSSPRRPRRSRG